MNGKLCPRIPKRFESAQVTFLLAARSCSVRNQADGLIPKLRGPKLRRSAQLCFVLEQKTSVKVIERDADQAPGHTDAKRHLEIVWLKQLIFC